MITDEHRFNEVTQKVIGASFEVANTLGRGFVEKVYANALCSEIEHRGILAKREWPVKVFYKGSIVGNFLCDLLVDEQLIIEVKATSGINNLHMAQCLNYLKATNLKLCLLINFGASSVQIKRIVNNF